MRMSAFSLKSEPESRKASARPWLTILGIGEDGRAGLSAAALAALDRAEFVVGGARHLALAGPLAARTLPWPSPIAKGYQAILARRGEPTCVLATGDPFHYGVGAELARLVPAEEIACFPHPSAFSLAAARLGWSLPDCECVSLHGRALERIIPHLQPGARLLALSWDGATPGTIAALLTTRGFGASTLTVLEAMGGERERIRRATAAEFSLPGIDPLNTIAIEVAAASDARILTLAPGLDDSWFDNDGQFTKAEIRAITLAALAPRAGELLWDIGAGTGSVGIEWCLRHLRNRCIGVEERPDRAARARRNALELGVTTLDVRLGQAPEALGDWPAPDAAFIGGGASDPGVFDAAWMALKPGGRLVINAVTLETETLLGSLYRQHGGAMRRIALSRLEPVGGMHDWRAAMPVTQWVVTKP
jgi:precorrin-6B C5,15-methyltransferase / cobalt-precorrin-6B C5,C15-methyltransferase